MPVAKITVKKGESLADRARKDARNAKLKLKRDANRILVKAREVIIGPKEDGKGWIKGSLANGNGGYCSVGATQRAQTELGLGKKALVEAQRQLGEVMNGSIIGTNDASRTKFPNVLIAFDLAVLGAGR